MSSIPQDEFEHTDESLAVVSAADTHLSATQSETSESTQGSANEITLLPFKAIHTFILSLQEEFGASNKPLRLYARLIEQTTFSHELPIQKHVQAFTTFCLANREAIYAKAYDRFVDPVVRYSERVFIDLKELFEKADADQRAVMWQHVLTISALVDSTGRAKQILKESLNQNSGASEANFLTDIIDKVEKNVKVDNTSNPFEAIGQIMNSGIFTELIGSMNDKVNSGQLDLSKMMGVVQSMIGTMTKDNPQMGQMFDTLMKTMDPAKMAEQFKPPSE
jgi:hypothetical protein